MRAIEQPPVILRKSPQQDVHAEIEIAAVGQRSDQFSLRIQHVSQLREQIFRTPQVLQDIRAEDIVEPLTHRRKSLFEIRLYEPHGGGKAICVSASPFNPRDIVPTFRQNRAEVTVTTSNIQHRLSSARR